MKCVQGRRPEPISEHDDLLSFALTLQEELQKAILRRYRPIDADGDIVEMRAARIDTLIQQCSKIGHEGKTA